MASTACQKVSWNATIARTPTNTVANSRFGDVQVQNRVSGRPCRSASGMYSAPPGSTATTRSPYSPSRICARTDGVGPVDADTEPSSGAGTGASRAHSKPPALRAGEDGDVPEPLEPALGRLRPLLAAPERLVRAVGAGRRRGAQPAFARVELRPVRLKSGLRLQVTTTDGGTPVPTIRTANHAPGEDAERAVDALLAEPFGNWHVETRDEVIQLRVTKSGERAGPPPAAGRATGLGPGQSGRRARPPQAAPARPGRPAVRGPGRGRRQAPAGRRLPPAARRGRRPNDRGGPRDRTARCASSISAAGTPT